MTLMLNEIYYAIYKEIIYIAFTITWKLGSKKAKQYNLFENENYKVKKKARYNKNINKF